MTVSEALGRLDTLKPNRYTQEDKLAWLTTVDAAVAQVLGVAAPEYAAADGTALLLAAPYDTAYLRYMEAQIDYHDGASEGCSMAMERYGKVLAAFRKHYQRTHVPARGGRFL